jgi:hypothetical protein
MTVQVTTNIPSCFGIVRVISGLGLFRCCPSLNSRDVPEVLAREHSLCHILTEFHHLLLIVPKEGIARPLSDKHDQENWAFAKMHCHGCIQFN